MSLQGQSRHFEDPNEARRQTEGPSIKHRIQTRFDAVARRSRARQPDDPAIRGRERPHFGAVEALPLPAPRRVASVDAVRGFTMFWIIGADGAAKALAEMMSGKGTILSTAGNIIGGQFEHAEWEGLRFYDLIFPLFIFVTGVAIVFSLMRLIAGRDETTDIVTGIVLMQKFERTMDVVQRVREAVARMNADGTLPPGVRIEPFYDRGDLVAITVRTVLNNMLFGVVLIFLIQWMFLGDLRSALIVSATIPVALFLAVIITVLRGESANLLSIGAIDLGIIVDATVIMVENIFRHLAHAVRREVSDPETRLSEKLRRILAAAVEVDRAILFSVIITIAAFLPLFTMQGVEGQIFGPMSRTYAYALLGAVIATFTETPVIASLLLPERVNEIETFLVRQIRKVYQFVLPLAVRRYRLSAMIALAFLAICGLLATRLGTEFLPKLEEGNLWIRGVMPPTIALDAGIETVARIG